MPGNGIQLNSDALSSAGVAEPECQTIPSRRLAENVAALSAVQFLNYVAPLLTIPYLVRVLGPSQFGMLAFAQGIVLYFSVITDYGFDFSATRSIAANRHIPGAVAKITWSTLAAKLLLMTLCGLSLALLVAFVPKLSQTPDLFAATFLYVVGTALFPIWLFQGLEELRWAAAAMGFARLLTVPAIFVFVHQPSDYVKAAAIQSSVEVVAAAVALPMFWGTNETRWSAPSFADVRRSFRLGWPLFLGGSALYLATSSTAVILGFTTTKLELGYFGAADKLIKAAISLLGPASQALYPRIAATKVKSDLLALHLIRRSFAVFGAISLTVSGILFCFAQPVCLLLLGPSFSHSAVLLQCLAPLPFLFGLLSVFGTQAMLVFEMDKTMSRIMLAGGLLGIPLTVFLSLHWGALGAAVASVITAALMVAAMAVSLHMRGLQIWRNPGSSA